MEKITFEFQKNRKLKPQKWLCFFVFFYSLFGVTITAQTVDLGSGTTTSIANSTASGLGPMNGYYAYMRYQVVYTAAEITAAGGTAGNYIEEFGFNVETPAAGVLSDYTIRFANTTETNSASHNTAGLTEVYSGDHTAVAGYNMIDLTLPFLWDGVSNILVDVCYGPVDFTSPYGTVFTYGTDTNSSRFARSDTGSRCGTDTNLANSFKPQARLVMAPPPSCFSVSLGSMEISDVTTDSATLTWEEPSSVPTNGYEYYVSDVNTDPTAGTTPTGSVTTGLTADLTLADPLTTYYVWVRANCGGGDLSEWAGPVSFTTLQVPAVLPFTEGFEGTINWSLVNGTQTNKWFIGTTVNNGGTQSLYVSSNATGANNDYSTSSTSTVHAYRDVAIPADVEALDLSFDWKAGGESTWDYLRVWAVPTTYTPAAGTQTTIANSSGIQVAQYLNLSGGSFITSNFQIAVSAYAGQTVRLIFEWRNDSGSGTQPGVAVDNINISESTCVQPSGLAAVVSAGNVNLSWTEPGLVPTSGYDYYIDDENTAPTSASAPMGNVPTGNTVSLTTLTPDMVHYFWIRSNCGSESTAWVSGGSFRTDCDVAVPSVVYEDFTSYTGTMPNPACWREASGVLSATPVYLPAGTSGWTNENYNNTAGDNGKAARLNLYGTDNEWIISPAINIGDGSIEYQLEYNASVIPWSGTGPVTNMGEKGVKVVISTDGGASWVDTNVIKTYDNTNIPAGGVSEVVLLTGFTGTVKIGFYAYSTTTDQDLRFYIDNFRVIEVPQCDKPLEFTLGEVGEDTAEISWTVPETAPAQGYQYYVSDVNTLPAVDATPNGTVAAGILEATVMGLVPSTTNYIWVRSACETDLFSEWVGPLTASTLCDAPDILTSAATPVCGTASSSLTATSSAGTIQWYAAETGGQALATGGTFETPAISENTTYYVTASTVAAPQAGGARASTAATGGTTPFDYGLVFDAYNAFTLNSVDVYLRGEDPEELTIILTDSEGEELETVTVNVPAGDPDAPVQHTVALGWDIPAGTAYRILATDGPSMVRESALGGFPYLIGDTGAVTNGYIAGTSTTYYFFYNWNFTASCAAPRVPVEVVVTDAPDITVTVSEEAICLNGSTDLNVTSANAGYTYMWMPGSLAGAMQTVTPTETTTYTVTATDAITGCVEVGQITVTVNPLPADFDSGADVEVCETGDAVTIIAAGGTVPTTILTENFNGIVNTWTTVNNSTGGDVADAAWTLRANGYEIPGYDPVFSNDNSQFYNTNSDAQGSGSTTNTILMSPVFSTVGFTSANVAFFHHFFEPSSGSSTATVEASIDGTNWVVLQTYDSTQGDYDAFASASIALTAAYLNQPTVYVRFKFVGDWRYFWSIDNVTIDGDETGEVTWAPATGLYLDAAATMPYVGEVAATVYAKPAVATTYTATVTSPAGCIATDDILVTPVSTAAPTATATQTFCNAATVANLTATGDMIKWYYEASGGTALASATVLLDGTVYYASQTVDGCESMARVAVTAEINVTPAPTVDEEVQLICNAGTVADLMATGTAIQWYTTATGGEALTPETALEGDISIYYASQTVDGCESSMRAAVAVFVNVVEAPMADAEQFFCNEGTVADLMPNGADITWYADATTTTPLTGETALVTGTTYYASQTIEGCESVARTAVMATINVTAAPTANAEQSFCAGGFVEELMAEGNDIMWYAAETGGEPLANGDVLVDGTTYYASQMVDGCESTVRTAVMVTINVTPAPEGDAMQTVEVNAAADATIEDLVVTGVEGGVIVWYPSEQDAINNTNPIAAGTQLESETTYYAVQFVGDCASEPFAVTATVALDIRDFASAEFNYYPNPVKDVLTISYSSNITSVTVYNMLGQPVISQNVNALEGKVNMTGLADGTYIVNVTAGSASKTIRIIKKQ